MASKKAKGNRVQVILECTEMKESGLPGTSRYVTVRLNNLFKAWQRKPSLPSTKAQRMVALTQRLSRW